MRRCWSPSWTNSDSGHTHYWPSIQSNASGNGPKWFLAPKNLGFDTKIKSVACPEVELLHHEEVHHLFREVDHVVDTHGNVVVRTKRDHFSKYAPKRSNHANFQLIKIKNKKVMTKKPLIVENTNPLTTAIRQKLLVFPGGCHISFTRTRRLWSSLFSMNPAQYLWSSLLSRASSQCLWSSLVFNKSRLII